MIAFLRAQDAVGPLAPREPVSLTDEDLVATQTTYFDRCAGCHGTRRGGATGPDISTEPSLALGTDTLRAVIDHGTPWGMPAWGDDAVLDAAVVDRLAAFLQLPVPEAPAFEIDLWSATPAAVARVRGCWDARSVETSRFPGFEDRFLVEGCYWPDMTVSDDPIRQRQVCVYSKAEGVPESCLDVATRGRVVHPEFNQDGSELWISVWDEQGEIVVYDAVTLVELTRIPDLSTPTGKLNVHNTAHDVY